MNEIEQQTEKTIDNIAAILEADTDRDACPVMVAAVQKRSALP
jgi:hypothetical protein